MSNKTNKYLIYIVFLEKDINSASGPPLITNLKHSYHSKRAKYVVIMDLAKLIIETRSLLQYKSNYTATIHIEKGY